jgi:peptidoglycan/LPS O-acetylase OafA/YrhL
VPAKSGPPTTVVGIRSGLSVKFLAARVRPFARARTAHHHSSISNAGVVLGRPSAVLTPEESRPAVATKAHPSPGFYLRELDGLRFFAFFGVFLHHLVSTSQLFDKSLTGEPWAHGFRKVAVSGWVGVDLFFVLSAFLITELLLREQERFGDISVGSFWVRRIMRIWPLYYLTIVLGFLILPMIPAIGLESGAGAVAANDLWSRHFLPFVLFAGNWSTVAYGYAPSPVVSPLWSVSVEEQFYLFWPLVIIFTPRVLMPRVLAVLLIATIVVRFILVVNGVAHPAIYANTLARLDPIVLGAGLAMAWRDGRIRAALIRWRALWLPLAVALFIFVLFGPNPLTYSIHTVWQFLAIGLACTGLVLATVSGGLAQKITRLAVFVWLGRISYGLYVYHRLGISLSELATTRLFPMAADGMSLVALDVVRSVIALGLTIMIAAISYFGFERYFLRVKARFARVASRPSV